MSMWSRLFTILAFILCLSTPAAAEESPLQKVIYDATEQAANHPDLDSALNQSIEELQNTELDGIPLSTTRNSEITYPTLEQTPFSTVRLIGKTEEGERQERWHIESPAMRRVVSVMVTKPAQPTAAPILYLLDGASAPYVNGWFARGNAWQQMQNEHLFMVLPTEAGGTHFANWQADDPTLGRSQWETFLTTELKELMQAELALQWDGRSFIGGLSMGGSAAVRLATSNPQLYDGVFGLSGCYSTTSTMGREFHNLVVRSAGGNPNLLWGNGTSAERLRVDAIRHTDTLRNIPIYLFTADGTVTPRDRQVHESKQLHELAGSALIEHLPLNCTKEFDQALRANNITHHKVVYQAGGVHNWTYYEEQLPHAWRHIASG